MKILKNYCFILLFVLAVHVGAHAQPGNQFQIKSARISYVYRGDFTGTENLTFDNYGSTELLIKKLHTAKGSAIVESKTLCLNDTLTELDLTTHQKHIAPLLPGEKTNHTLDMLKAGHFKKSGKVTIAGCTCQKYTGEMGSICIWKGVILQSEISVADKTMIKTAVLVDTVTPIKPSLFSINDH